jgi:hypothetical protein
MYERGYDTLTEIVKAFEENPELNKLTTTTPKEGHVYPTHHRPEHNPKRDKTAEYDCYDGHSYEQPVLTCEQIPASLKAIDRLNYAASKRFSGGKILHLKPSLLAKVYWRRTFL